MKSTSTSRHLSFILSQYSGKNIQPDRIHAVEDPSISGVYAVRWFAFANRPRREVVVGEFLIDVKAGTQAAIESIEEVEFKSWPPKSGRQS